MKKLVKVHLKFFEMCRAAILKTWRLFIRLPREMTSTLGKSLRPYGLLECIPV